jgi:hypothetical protein
MATSGDLRKESPFPGPFVAEPSESVKGPVHKPGHQSFWLWVMCLTGVDYFSTLGYQPSVAFEATGLLTPFATVVLVLVTLFGALPVYARVAAKSPHGQGSIAMLEKLLHGWGGKFLILALLGFAATDFVITKTLSAADAAAHLVENPLVRDYFSFSSSQVVVTMILLVALGAMFLRGFREVIVLAVVIVAVYLILNLIVVGSGLFYLSTHPGEMTGWLQTVTDPKAVVGSPPPGSSERALYISDAPLTPGGSWLGIVAISLLLFPKLALGLSGFETGVAVMPLVKGDPDDTGDRPKGRIRNVRKLLLTAALIMSVFLLGSSLVTSTLIAPRDLEKKEVQDPQTGKMVAVKGKAVDRALAYLAHGERLANGRAGTDINPMFGEIFGTLYDVSTIIILWFAGASAMAGLLNLVPQYLPRYGMAPEWTKAIRPLVILFTAINLFVTWVFDARVDAQSAAYATGVLMLISSACVANVIDIWRSRAGRIWLVRLSWPFAFITMVFVYTTLANIWEKPTGLFIASFFIGAILLLSLISRFFRSTELRFMGFEFVEGNSRFLWDSLKHLEFPALVPHRPGGRSLREKEETIRREHHLGPDVPIVFLEAHLGDPSDFYQTPCMEIKQEEGLFIIKVTRVASIPHVIAAIALELSKVGRPPEIHFGWSAERPVTASISFLLFGEGNVPWMVRELILDAEPNPERQPRVIIG